MSVYRPWQAILACLTGIVAGAILSYFAIVSLGVATGAIAICATAPQWWVYSFIVLGIAAECVGTAFGGIWANRLYRKSRTPQGA